MVFIVENEYDKKFNVEDDLYSMDITQQLIFKVLFGLKKDMSKGISSFRLQKTLYYLKKELTSDNPLKKSLNFFWYFYGPYSTPIKDSFNNIKKELRKNNTSFTLTEDIFSEIENKEEEVFYLINENKEAINILNKLTNNKKKFFKLEEEIYKKAPYDFMYDYKFGIFSKFENLKECEELDLDEIIDKFYKCEASLPIEGYFDKYNDIFSNFVTELDYLNQRDLFDTNNILMKNLPIDIWKKFCLGLRVKHHDSFYKSSVAGWDKEFKSKITFLERDVLKLLKIRYNGDISSEKINTSPNFSKLLNVSVGSYVNR